MCCERRDLKRNLQETWIMIRDDELINRIRNIIEADEFPVIKVVDIQFLFDEYDRRRRENL